jgi:hypothetical protein
MKRFIWKRRGHVHVDTAHITDTARVLKISYTLRIILQVIKVLIASFRTWCYRSYVISAAVLNRTRPGQVCGRHHGRWFEPIANVNNTTICGFSIMVNRHALWFLEHANLTFIGYYCI